MLLPLIAQLQTNYLAISGSASKIEDITQVFEAYVEQEKSKMLAALCAEKRLDSLS